MAKKSRASGLFGPLSVDECAILSSHLLSGHTKQVYLANSDPDMFRDLSDSLGDLNDEWAAKLPRRGGSR